MLSLRNVHTKFVNLYFLFNTYNLFVIIKFLTILYYIKGKEIKALISYGVLFF